jgi:hypothetical protein
LVSSASTLAGTVYFLIRIWYFPSISLADALLMGIALTLAVILCGYGIVSGRGTIPESALLVSLSWNIVDCSLHTLSSIFTVSGLNM